MSMNLFDAFGPLDDLIQVIYQASHRFVLLSRVEFDAPVPGWQIYLGLADKGRWWKGRWEEKDVDAFVGKNVSSDLLEAFADNIANSVMQGELYVGGMGTTEPGADMKMIFGPNGTKPLEITLTELSSQEATVFVTNEFFELGLNAQKRKCKLNPPAFQTFTSVPPAASHEHRHRHSPPPAKKPRKASLSPSPSPLSTKSERRNSPPRKRIPEKTPAPPSENSGTTKPKPKVAPIKRGRMVQKLEFASDED